MNLCWENDVTYEVCSVLKKRGEIEEWLRKVFFGMDRGRYVLVIRHRSDAGEEYKFIPFSSIKDIRRGYIYVGEDIIPLHRVLEIRSVNGEVIYSRRKTTS